MSANYVTVTPALAELIGSLPQDEVPIKLRCAICSKLAVNAFKTPCCEQMICENCKLSLPSTCPVCEHTPISADDCNPNKSLRMTTRAFLKTAEKKRDTSHVKDPTPATSVDAKLNATPAVPEKTAPAHEGQTDATPAPAQATDEILVKKENPADQDAGSAQAEEGKEAQPSADTEAQSGDQVTGDAANQETQVEVRDESNEEQGDAEADPTKAEDGNESNDVENQQKPAFPNAFGFGSMNGPFPNMNSMNFSGGDFNQMNQMQMMMAMQNGMGPNGFGFPMMGMSGMGMDPSMMNMYQMNNGFGAPGMDMSMMNSGMGGFNGGVGSEENWNGPQSWNNGQNNYNHPNASGMGNGDYGNFNSGYHTGYNQGNFGPHNQFNDYRRGGYFRGRGRGRGYGNYMRGGYGYGQQGNYQSQNYMNQQQYGSNMMGQGPNMTGQESNGSQAVPNVSSGEDGGDKNVDEFGRTLRPETKEDGSTTDGQKTSDGKTANENGDASAKVEDGTGQIGYNPGHSAASNIEHSGSNGETSGNGVPADSHMRPSGQPFGAFQRAGSFGGMPPPAAPAPDVPLNAPKGPKAMRHGLPNTSLLNLRARGYQIPGEESKHRVQSPGVQSGAASLATPIDDDRDHRRSRSNSIASSVKRRDQDPENSRDEQSDSRSRSGRDRDRDRSRHRDRRGRDRDGSETRSTSRSRSREHKDKKRKSHRAEEDDREYDKERRHRHRSSKKYYDDEEDSSKGRSTREDKYDDRSRSASPVGSRKSGHRSSRKERDSERRRERERDRDRDRESEDDRDYKRKSGHRSSHRDRDHERSDRSDRDRDRKRTRDGDRDRDRDKDRDRDRDRDKRRSKHSTTEPPTPTEPEVKEFNPPTGPRGSISKNYSIFSAPKHFEIKGASTSSSSSPASAAPPKGPTADSDRRSSTSSKLDPHAAEREARNRERLLKETQRLAGLTGLKRRSTADPDGGGSASSRKRGRRGGEAVAEDADEEARMKRLEAEREESRWG